MPRPGEVYSFVSEDAGYKKYHLCISLEGCFLYLNTPRAKSFPGDFTISNTDVPFLPATESGDSIIACNLVIHKSDAELRKQKVKLLGSVRPDLLRKLLLFIEATPVMSEADREAALDGLGEWC